MAGISISLGGNFAKLDELKSKALSTANSVKGSFSGVGKALALGGIGLSAGGTIAAMGAAMKSAIDAGGELSDVMARTGASGRDLVILEQAFVNAGVEAGKVPTALNRMQKAIAGVNDDGEQTANAFNKIGMNIRDLQGMDAVGAFRAIGERIAGIQDPASRTAAAMEIFGKSGGEMLVMMTDSSAWQSARDQVGGYGDLLAENAERFDAIGDSVANFQVAAKTLGTVLASNLAPALEWMAEAMQAFNSGVNIFSGLQNPFASTPQGFKNPIASDLDISDRSRARRQAEQMVKDDPNNGRSRKEDDQAALERANAAFWAGKEAEKQDLITKAAEKKREADEKAAVAAAKKAKETEKAMALAADEYKLEAALIQARLTGDKDREKKLNREKEIREEMAKLTRAGFDEATARRQSGLMVDARSAADKAERERKDNLQSNATGLGGFAQSMNVLFGRSANAGLVEENKRQTKVLQEIRDGLRTAPPGMEIKVVPTF